MRVKLNVRMRVKLNVRVRVSFGVKGKNKGNDKE